MPRQPTGSTEGGLDRGLGMAKMGRSSVIGRQAVRIITDALPPEWTSEPVLEDWGRDLMIEVFTRGESTGLIICAQSKGQQRVKVAKGTHVKQRIKAGQLRYLVEYGGPTVLFVVDVTKRSIWWATPQVDTAMLKKVAAAEEDDDELTVRVPLANRLDANNLDSFMAAIDAAAQRVALNSLTAGDFGAFFDALEADSNLGNTTRTLQRNADAARMQHAYVLMHSGKPEEAAKELAALLGSPSSEAHVKISAFIYEEALALHQAFQAKELDASVRELALGRAIALKESMAGEAKPYRIFARANLRITELHLLAERRFMLTIQLGASPNQLGAMVSPELPAIRIALANAINRTIKRVLRMLELALTECRPFIPVLIQKAQTALTPLWGSVSVEDDEQSKAKVMELVNNLTNLGIDVSTKMKDWQHVEAIAFGTTSFPREGKTAWDECADRAADLLKNIEDDNTREAAEQRIRDHLMRMKKEWAAAGGYDHEGYTQMLRNLAYTEGIDVDNGADASAELVRLGLKDLSPQRIIGNCEHLFVAMRAVHPLGAHLHIPSIGIKELWCTLHGYLHLHEDLDAAYTSFNEAHCKGCSDCAPRGAHFTWTPDWQIAEAKRLIAEGKIPRLCPIDPTSQPEADSNGE